MRRLCHTELHEWSDTGKVLGVTLCRLEMRLSTAGRHRGPTTPWVWVCPNSACGTARVLTQDETRTVLREMTHEAPE